LGVRVLRGLRFLSTWAEVASRLAAAVALCRGVARIDRSSGYFADALLLSVRTCCVLLAARMVWITSWPHFVVHAMLEAVAGGLNWA